MEKNQMWSVLLKEAQKCEKSKMFEDCVDLSSELMVYYLKNISKAEKTFRELKKGKTTFLFVDMKDVAREQRKKKSNFNITADMQAFVQIRQLAYKYGIAITEDNAFKFHKLLNETDNLFTINRSIFKIANIIATYNNSESRNTDLFKDVSLM